MAYMNQEMKKEIAGLLKAVVPKSWKYTLSVRSHSAICFNLKQAPVDFFEIYGYTKSSGNFQLNMFSSIKRINDVQLRGDMGDLSEFKDTMMKIIAILNKDNYNRNNSMFDYFDVGHYVEFNVGQWDKPFILA